MYYIEQHSDSKILKLGIKWALYREKKPERKYYNRSWDKIDNPEYLYDLKCWQQSRIAYLKEPGFKVGDTIYDLFPNSDFYGKKYKIESINGDNYTLIGENNKKVRVEGGNFKLYHSQYYPGQEVESFKYVRETKIHSYINKKVKPKGRHFPEWQEVEEPIDRANHKAYTQFQEDVDKAIILAEI